MNPFEDEQDNNISNKLINVELWLEINGRRKNTYISGLTLEKDEQKKHLQKLKKIHGCNGTLKKISEEGKDIEVIQLQGDNIENVQNYLKIINITNITIRNFQSK
jgi:translation initiation factor 1 (eIF-1/SUI1)